MSNEKINKYGLFDKAIRIKEKERIVLSREDIERQRDAGAFHLTHSEAVCEGFVNPYDEQDCVIVSVEDENAEV